ncbi:hypothetical protein C5167_003886, partial [Papaver somniferum]
MIVLLLSNLIWYIKKITVGHRNDFESAEGYIFCLQPRWEVSCFFVCKKCCGHWDTFLFTPSKIQLDIREMIFSSFLFLFQVSSSPVEPPEIKYGYSTERKEWNWLDMSSPVSNYSMKFSIMKIPVHDASVDLPDGARTPYESICVSSKTRKSGACDLLIVILHGGPHSILLTNFNKNYPFLSTLGYSLLIRFIGIWGGGITVAARKNWIANKQLNLCRGDWLSKPAES